MICGNDFARQWKAELEREAHVSTVGVRVVIMHPRFTGSCALPHYVGGTIRMPACLFDGTFDWAKTWRHELQHADDDRTGLLRTITSDEAEVRARAVEAAS